MNIFTLLDLERLELSRAMKTQKLKCRFTC